MIHTVPLEAITVAKDDTLFLKKASEDRLLSAYYMLVIIPNTLHVWTLIFIVSLELHPYFINKENEV